MMGPIFLLSRPILPIKRDIGSAFETGRPRPALMSTSPIFCFFDALSASYERVDRVGPIGASDWSYRSA